MNLEGLGKIILLVALVLLLVGSSLYIAGRFLGMQHLPGDIQYKKGDYSFSFPLGTCIILSVIVTIILNAVFFVWKKR